MVAHIEDGFCRNISQNRFVGLVQHKLIIRRILEQPELSRVVTDSHKADRMDGGIRLDEDGDPSSWPSLGKSASTECPSLPQIQEVDGKKGKGKVSDKDDANKQQQGNNAAKTVWGGKSAARLYPDSSSNASSPIFPSLPGAKATLPYRPAPSATKPDAAAATKVAASSAAAAAAAREAHIATSSTKGNMFHAHFWDPQDDAYDPERFYDIMYEHYICPFPDCE